MVDLGIASIDMDNLHRTVSKHECDGPLSMLFLALPFASTHPCRVYPDVPMLLLPNRIDGEAHISGAEKSAEVTEVLFRICMQMMP